MDIWQEYYQSLENDSRATAELVRAALDERFEDEQSRSVCVLHYRGSVEVLERAKQLCASPSAKERRLGVYILGQLGQITSDQGTFREDRLQILLQMLQTEPDPTVLGDIGIALGHLHDRRSIDNLADFVTAPSSHVRYGVVLGLLGFSEQRAITALIELSHDFDQDVRNWATFGLGSMIETDTPEIRDSLFERLQDDDFEVRGEALLGLARRRDRRVLPFLISELGLPRVSSFAIQAAHQFPDASLRQHLIGVRTAAVDHADAELLDEAIRRSSS